MDHVRAGLLTIGGPLTAPYNGGMSKASRTGVVGAVCAGIVVAVGAPQRAAAQCTTNETGKCNSSEMTTSGQFGFALSISGNVMAIGAPQDNTNGDLAGAAFIHRYNGT